MLTIPLGIATDELRREETFRVELYEWTAHYTKPFVMNPDDWADFVSKVYTYRVLPQWALLHELRERSEGQFRAYIRVTVKNAWLNEIRGEQYRPRLLNDKEMKLEELSGGECIPSPAAEVEARETLEKALRTLKPFERKVVELWLEEDGALGVIAQRVGKTIPYVCRVRQRAFEKLLDFLMD